jgi:hypothetical protein
MWVYGPPQGEKGSTCNAITPQKWMTSSKSDPQAMYGVSKGESYFSNQVNHPSSHVMNQHLENDKKSMNNSPLRGGNLLLQYIQCTR